MQKIARFCIFSRYSPKKIQVASLKREAGEPVWLGAAEVLLPGAVEDVQHGPRHRGRQGIPQHLGVCWISFPPA